MLALKIPVKWVHGLILLTLFTAGGLQAQSKEKLEKEIIEIIRFEPDVDMDLIPGFVIGVIQRDSTYIYAYGQRNLNDSQAPDENTQFEIGGLTKIFTAALVKILAEEGILHLDSTVQYYLPTAYHNPDLSHLTILDLLAHRSGLPLMPSEFGTHQIEVNNPYSYYSKEQLLTFYRDFQALDKKPKYTYSHVNYALLEIVCERATGRTFQKLLEEKIFKVLGMEDSFITIPDSADMAQGYGVDERAVAPWTFASFAGSEGVKSSMHDLLRFVRCNMADEACVLSPLLIKTQEKLEVSDYSPRVYAGMGWHIIERKKYYSTIVHTGFTSGFRSFIAFVPQTQTTVVLLCNSESTTGGLGYHILRMLNNNWKKKRKK